MNTAANNIASKLFVAFVAVAMLFTLATPAKAATAEELQEMINDLLAQVASLQGQVGQDSSAAGVRSVCPFTWTRSLSSGSTGADVMKLQQFLNSDTDTRVSASGVGSVGAETQYFGPATAAAVSKFQVKYRSDVLSPAGLVNPTGYFGPGSMGKANALCVQGAPADDTDDDSDDDMSDDSDDDMSSGDLGGEASLDALDISSGDDDEVEEGEEDATVAEVTVEFADGDAMITRLDVSITGAGDAWDVLDSVSLWVDGDMVAEEDGSDEDNYLDEDDGTLRFGGLDIVAMEDEEVDIVIAVTLQDGIDDSDLGTFSVSADSMRFVDGDDVTSTETTAFDLGDPGETVDFEITEAGAEDELIVKTSSTDPDGGTLQLEDDSDSDWFTLFAFDLDTDDSVNDIELNSVPVTITFSSSTYATLVDDVELVIDGVTIDDVTASATLTGATLTFDVDGDVVIEAGERVTAELMVKFNSLALGNEGVTASGTITSAQADLIDAEGAEDLTASQLSGAAEGDDHTLRTAGVDVTAGDMEAEVTVVDGSSDYATYSIEVEVTAFEQDVYISTAPGTSISYTLEDSSSSSSVAGTRTVTLSSTGDEVGSTFEITEGETETLTLEVTYTPGVASTASRLQLNSITFGSSSGTPTGQSWTASPDTDYRTSVVTIVN